MSLFPYDTGSSDWPAVPYVNDMQMDIQTLGGKIKHEAEENSLGCTEQTQATARNYTDEELAIIWASYNNPLQLGQTSLLSHNEPTSLTNHESSFFTAANLGQAQLLTPIKTDPIASGVDLDGSASACISYGNHGLPESSNRVVQAANLDFPSQFEEAFEPSNYSTFGTPKEFKQEVPLTCQHSPIIPSPGRFNSYDTCQPIAFNEVQGLALPAHKTCQDQHAAVSNNCNHLYSVMLPSPKFQNTFYTDHLAKSIPPTTSTSQELAVYRDNNAQRIGSGEYADTSEEVATGQMIVRPQELDGKGEPGFHLPNFFQNMNTCEQAEKLDENSDECESRHQQHRMPASNSLDYHNPTQATAPFLTAIPGRFTRLFENENVPEIENFDKPVNQNNQLSQPISSSSFSLSGDGNSLNETSASIWPNNLTFANGSMAMRLPSVYPSRSQAEIAQRDSTQLLPGICQVHTQGDRLLQGANSLEYGHLTPNVQYYSCSCGFPNDPTMIQCSGGSCPTPQKFHRRCANRVFMKCNGDTWTCMICRNQLQPVASQHDSSMSWSANTFDLPFRDAQYSSLPYTNSTNNYLNNYSASENIISDKVRAPNQSPEFSDENRSLIVKLKTIPVLGNGNVIEPGQESSSFRPRVRAPRSYISNDARVKIPASARHYSLTGNINSRSYYPSCQTYGRRSNGQYRTELPQRRATAWSEYEEDKCIELMKEVKLSGEVKRIDALWEAVSQRLYEVYRIQRTPGGVKNAWNRNLRAKSGFDERLNPQPDRMRTGLLPKLGSGQGWWSNKDVNNSSLSSPASSVKKRTLDDMDDNWSPNNVNRRGRKKRKTFFGPVKIEDNSDEADWLE